jgi:DNA polymerase III gamma/tau subunit
MEQFIVSARKYRPQTFNDVVGQKSNYQYFAECHRKQSPLPYYLQGLEELENNLRSYFG